VKCIIQRVSSASVTVEGEVVGKINKGLLILVGFAKHDTKEQLGWMAEKVLNLRCFSDHSGKMTWSVKETKGEILTVSQFTLYGNCKKGRRPSFEKAAESDNARVLYGQWINCLKGDGLVIESGRFGEMMDVSLVNHGPVTFELNSDV